MLKTSTAATDWPEINSTTSLAKSFYDSHYCETTKKFVSSRILIKDILLFRKK